MPPPTRVRPRSAIIRAEQMDAAHKIERYEELLNEQLKVELQNVQDERDALYEKIRSGEPDRTRFTFLSFSHTH